MKKINPLLSICRLASQERWCLDLHCTTCENFDFRIALLKISSGDIPITSGVGKWSRRKNIIETASEPESPHLPFTLEQKHNILNLCDEVKIDKLAESGCDEDNHSYYRAREHFLMCLGILLDHMSKSEDHERGFARQNQSAEFKKLSNILSSKLLEWEDMSTQNSEWLTRLMDDPDSWLTWEDLSRFA